jgi:hypothetical protein
MTASMYEMAHALLPPAAAAPYEEGTAGHGEPLDLDKMGAGELRRVAVWRGAMVRKILREQGRWAHTVRLEQARRFDLEQVAEAVCAWWRAHKAAVGWAPEQRALEAAHEELLGKLARSAVGSAPSPVVAALVELCLDLRSAAGPAREGLQKRIVAHAEQYERWLGSQSRARLKEPSEGPEEEGEAGGDATAADMAPPAEEPPAEELPAEEPPVNEELPAAAPPAEPGEILGEAEAEGLAEPPGLTETPRDDERQCAVCGSVVDAAEVEEAEGMCFDCRARQESGLPEAGGEEAP